MQNLKRISFELFIEKLGIEIKRTNLENSLLGANISELQQILFNNPDISDYDLYDLENQFIQFSQEEDTQSQISMLMPDDPYYLVKLSTKSQNSQLVQPEEIKENKLEINGNYHPKNRIIEIKYINQKLIISLKKIYNILVFEGGGAKGLAYPAAVNGLYEKNLVNDIFFVGGSSAGAITAAICALGYKGKQLEDIVDSVDANILLDRQMLEKGAPTLLASSRYIGGATIKRAKKEGEYYINTGNNLLMKAREIIKNRFEACYQEAPAAIKVQMEKFGIKANIERNRITFLDLKYMTLLFPNEGFKDLVVTATQMCSYSGDIAGQDFFNVIDTPHAEIAFAVRMSASIPYVFKRERYLGQYYIDGGITQNLPLDFFMNREEFKGEILALKFNRLPKEDKKKPSLKLEQRLLASSAGGNLNPNDWAEFSFGNRNLAKRAAEYGVDFFTVEQDMLTTMSFDADYNTIIKPAREKTKAKLHEQFSVHNPVKAIDLSRFSQTELKEYIYFLEHLDRKDILFQIEDRIISSSIHHNNLKKEVLSVLRQEVQQRMVAGEALSSTKESLMALDTIECLSQETLQKEFFRDLTLHIEMLTDFKSNEGYKNSPHTEASPFAWLYSEINEQAKKTQNREIQQWCYNLLKFASPCDIILSRGIVFLENAKLYRSGNNADKNFFLIRTQILNELSEKMARKYGYYNIQQLRDATGEYLKEKYTQQHLSYFQNQKPKNIQQLLSSPFVIKDILSINRINDLDTIEYGESGIRTTARSTLVTAFKKEISSGNPRWLIDLLICCQLYDNFQNNVSLQNRFAKFAKQDAKHAFFYYVTHVYRYGFDIDLKGTECSAMVKLLTNSKLTSTDSNFFDYQGRIAIILRDFGNEVSSYFKGLQHDIKQVAPNAPIIDILNLPNIQQLLAKKIAPAKPPVGSDLDTRKRAWKDYYVGIKSLRLELNVISEFQELNLKPLCNLTIEDFDQTIYSENQSLLTISTGLSNRKRHLQDLCNYVNCHTHTWYEDLFSVNSFLEFKENPLLMLLSSNNLSDKAVVIIIERLVEFYYAQLNELMAKSQIQQDKTASSNQVTFFKRSGNNTLHQEEGNVHVTPIY